MRKLILLRQPPNGSDSSNIRMDERRSYENIIVGGHPDVPNTSIEPHSEDPTPDDVSLIIQSNSMLHDRKMNNRL